MEDALRTIGWAGVRRVWGDESARKQYFLHAERKFLALPEGCGVPYFDAHGSRVSTRAGAVVAGSQGGHEGKVRPLPFSLSVAGVVLPRSRLTVGGRMWHGSRFGVIIQGG